MRELTCVQEVSGYRSLLAAAFFRREVSENTLAKQLNLKPAKDYCLKLF